jgi:hypothetical protein
MRDTDELIRQIASLKRTIAEMDDERRTLEAELIQYMDSSHVKTLETDTGKATLVKSTSLRINEVALSNELTPAQWRKITRRVLDQKLLEDAVSRGSIDVNLVAKHSTEEARKPYLKLTPKE